MLLAIDVGNTDVCFALFKKDSLLYKWRARTHTQYTKDEWAIWLRQILEIYNLSFNDINGAIISSVVPIVTESLREFCTTYLNRAPLVVGESSTKTDVLSKIDRPGEEGSDLIVNAVAAHSLYGGPLLIISFGTATTLSFVDYEGHFCGTVIAPGLNCSLEALYRSAAKLPMITIGRTQNIIGTNTHDSMLAGVFWGHVCMVEGLIKRAKKECMERFNAANLKVIATGGLAELIKPTTDIIDMYDADLTLSGLAIIYDKNRK